MDDNNMGESIIFRWSKHTRTIIHFLVAQHDIHFQYIIYVLKWPFAKNKHDTTRKLRSLFLSAFLCVVYMCSTTMCSYTL